ncbi:MAG: T9SS type A sorting domain-containing protein [candidate division Zixibacteria bacterium]|nr:T9SS type A sorting domain-containing protein [candidate division Zixibacteria bacterium]
MRCHEIRKRLSDLSAANVTEIDDSALTDHLKNCDRCAAFARAELALRRDLNGRAAEDLSDGMPLSVLKTRVEARANLTSKPRIQELRIMTAFTNQLKQRPRISATLALALVALLIMTLIPFTFDDTIGYEVAFAGVDKNLALDEDRLNELISAFGMEGVGINVGDCDVTCKVVISDVKSEGDVKILVEAFDRMGHCTVERIDSLTGNVSKYLYQQVSNKVFFGARNNHSPKDIQEFVVQRMDSLGNSFSIWMSADCAATDTPDCKDVMNNTLAGRSINLATSWEPGEAARFEYLAMDATGKDHIVIEGEDGATFEIDLAAENAAERLAERGIELSVIENEDGSFAYALTTGAQEFQRMELSAKSLDPAAKPAGDQLPDRYSLAQNYPNPFNPTTTIDFDLAASKLVSLEVFNIQGRKVRTLIDEVLFSGSHSVQWDATDDAGEQVATGVYLYRLTAGDFTQTKKMSFVK